MKNLLIIILVPFFLSSCKGKNEIYLEISADKDSVEIGETYRAELHLINYDYTYAFPEHFVVRKGIDTVLFMVDDNHGFGIYQYSSAVAGGKSFEGFVVFQDNHAYDTIPFKEEFYVIE